MRDARATSTDRPGGRRRAASGHGGWRAGGYLRLERRSLLALARQDLLRLDGLRTSNRRQNSARSMMSREAAPSKQNRRGGSARARNDKRNKGLCARRLWRSDAKKHRTDTRATRARLHHRRGALRLDSEPRPSRRQRRGRRRRRARRRGRRRRRRRRRRAGHRRRPRRRIVVAEASAAAAAAVRLPPSSTVVAVSSATRAVVLLPPPGAVVAARVKLGGRRLWRRRRRWRRRRWRRWRRRRGRAFAGVAVEPEAARGRLYARAPVAAVRDARGAWAAAACVPLGFAARDGPAYEGRAPHPKGRARLGRWRVRARRIVMMMKCNRLTGGKTEPIITSTIVPGTGYM